MMGCGSFLVTIGCAIYAGLAGASLWWLLIPAFVAGSFQLSNGPWFDRVVTANRDGRLGLFPMALAIHTLVVFALAATAAWIAGLFR